jgi:hypothetical protein
MERGQTGAAGEDDCILGHPLRDVRELDVHDARRSRSSSRALARESGRGRIPERCDRDHRLPDTYYVGTSKETRTTWVRQTCRRIVEPRSSERRGSDSSLKFVQTGAHLGFRSPPLIRSCGTCSGRPSNHRGRLWVPFGPCFNCVPGRKPFEQHS